MTKHTPGEKPVLVLIPFPFPCFTNINIPSFLSFFLLIYSFFFFYFLNLSQFRFFSFKTNKRLLLLGNQASFIHSVLHVHQHHTCFFNLNSIYKFITSTINYHLSKGRVRTFLFFSFFSCLCHNLI